MLHPVKDSERHYPYVAPAECDHHNLVIGDVTLPASDPRSGDIFCANCDTVFCAHDPGSWQNPQSCDAPADEREMGMAFCAAHAEKVRALLDA